MIRSARVGRRPPRFAVTVVALIVVFAVAWVFFLRAGVSTPAPAISAIQGTYSWRSSSPAEVEDGTFSAVSGGNAGGTTAVVTSAYDAAERTTTTVDDTGARSPRSSVSVGFWPPIWLVATHSPLDYQGLAAVVRSAVEERDASVGVKPLQDGDREVWRAAMTIDRRDLELVVDQLTGIVTWYSDARSTFTAEVAWDSPPPAGKTYVIDFPERTVAESQGGLAYAASRAAAGRAAGYDPLVSDLAPDGFALKSVATTPAELRPVSWISAEFWNPPGGLSGAAVLELYTRGLSQFTVEQVGPATMRTLTDIPDWQGEAAAGKLSPQETTLQYGAFKGATASTWYQESGPSLFVAKPRRAVFVTGALTREELVSFAEGLGPDAAP
jgi:hypothetical protein